MHLRHDILKAVPMMIAGFVLAYCAFYLLFGNASIFALQSLEIQEAKLQTHLAEAKSAREDIEDRVMRLRPDSLDWDLVEQEAHGKLGTRSKDAKALTM